MNRVMLSKILFVWTMIWHQVIHLIILISDCPILGLNSSTNFKFCNTNTDILKNFEFCPSLLLHALQKYIFKVIVD